ncbi:class I SAM-dependent DNA methyltransferase [Pseudomonas oryzihabitans]|uniref:SAM-dependent methyltransferase n=1 Tax=Pseudomonas oryzihabitans TaxID=47885 RepID=A0AAJ2F106_9PSED|nr:class I SAM-dependent methyltransferase [Pseudomonas psychrotolerans]MDR6235995.1 SAM-dependent methyltransferase [Pseudomonas psychrotolerans]MDR6354697.1 SAM-dependent methyltransferase [Pseudomonas psychrotolerans]
MSATALYTDLSAYYDLLCADIDYRAQSEAVLRLQRLFGNGGSRHLDLACGTGPHVRHFLDTGFQSSGLDLNPPMLAQAALRCPEAQFSCQDMCAFELEQPVDLITCFLYSLHYSASLERLQACLERVHAALTPGGLFCFNAVDKRRIDNASAVGHSVERADGYFNFASAWHYPGEGERQQLRLRIERYHAGERQTWQDEHPMVAVDFPELLALLEPCFEVQVLEHDYQRIEPWDGASGNALFVCVKR